MTKYNTGDLISLHGSSSMYFLYKVGSMYEIDHYKFHVKNFDQNQYFYLVTDIFRNELYNNEI